MMRYILSFLVCAVLLTACQFPKQEEPTPPQPQDSVVVIPPLGISDDYMGPVYPIGLQIDWKNLPWFDIGNDILGFIDGIVGMVSESVGLGRAAEARKAAAAAVTTLNKVILQTKNLTDSTKLYCDSLVYYSRRALGAVQDVTEKTRLEQHLQRQQLQVSMLNQELALTSSMRNDSMCAIVCETLKQIFSYNMGGGISEEDVYRNDSLILSKLYPILHEWIGPDNKRYKDLIAYIDWVLNTKEPIRQWDIFQVADNIAQDMNAWNLEAEQQKLVDHLYRSAFVNNYALVVQTYLISCTFLDKPTRHTYANAYDIQQHLDSALKQYNKLLQSHPLKKPQQTVCNIYGCHFTADTIIYTIPYPLVSYKKDYLSTPDSIVFGFNQNVSLTQQRACQLSPKEVSALYRYYYPNKTIDDKLPLVDSILVAKAGMTKQSGSGQPWLLLNGPVNEKNKDVTCAAVCHAQGTNTEKDYQGVSMGTLTWQNNKYTGWRPNVCWYRLNIVKH